MWGRAPAHSFAAYERPSHTHPLSAYTCASGWLCCAVLCCVGRAASVCGSVSAEYLGCYADRAETLKRALPYLQELSADMTVSSCLSKCASLGFEYAGLEYRSECYCSARPPPYERLREEQCATPCGGGGAASCGGALSLSVYRQAPVVAPSFDAARPLLCLVMILKDEAHTVAATLGTVHSVVDCWVILDTGSTDGTPRVIEDWFAANPSERTGKVVPGQLFHEPFIDYGATRYDQGG